MAKRNRKTTQKQTQKRLKEGRGSGNFEDYKPWLQIQDVASQGLATRIKGYKTGRIHHFLSKTELELFLLFEWSEKVIDIKEQFPLDQPETIALAKELGFKHPTDPRTQESIVMTTDLVLTVRQPVGKKEFARTVKFSKDLLNPRVLEKLEIERLYWKERNIDWGIVTERDIDKVLAKNIGWVRTFSEPGSLPPSLEVDNIPKVERFLYRFVKDRAVPLRSITKSSDTKFSLDPGSSLSLVKHLIATREWIVKMSQPIHPSRPLNFIKRRSV